MVKNRDQQARVKAVAGRMEKSCLRNHPMSSHSAKILEKILT